MSSYFARSPTLSMLIVFGIVIVELLLHEGSRRLEVCIRVETRLNPPLGETDPCF
jgi:hypothetical protein